MTKRVLVLSTLMAVGMAGTASAQYVQGNMDAAQTQMFIKQEEENKTKDNRTTAPKCEKTFSVTLDWPSFIKAEPSWNSPANYCYWTIAALDGLCGEDAKHKASILSKVNAIHCSKGATRSAKLEKGTLFFVIDWNAANDVYYLIDYLKKVL